MKLGFVHRFGQVTQLCRPRAGGDLCSIQRCSRCRDGSPPAWGRQRGRNNEQGLKLNLQFIRFSVGALSYNLAAYLLYTGLILLKCNYLVASTASFITGVTFGYFMNKYIVFANHKHDNRASFFYYFGYNIFLLGLNLSALFFLVNCLKINPFLAQILVIMIVALISYNVMRILFHGSDKNCHDH